jgi:hypothetical protein
MPWGEHLGHAFDGSFKFAWIEMGLAQMPNQVLQLDPVLDELAPARANEPETIRTMRASGGLLNVAEQKPHTFKVLEKYAKEQFKATGVIYSLLD